MFMRFGMNNVKSINIPFASYFNPSSSLCPSNKEENDYMSCVLYFSVVGSLMYVMVCTRLDISHAVDVINRYMEDPGRQQWEAVKWMFRYLRGTSAYCITYNG
jgi:hypothetical protein